MKSLAKKLVRHRPSKIVRVDNIQTHLLGRCLENAVNHHKETGSKIVWGWLVMPSTGSLRPETDGMMFKHFWNKLNGRYIDTTAIPINDGTYVLSKEDEDTWRASYKATEYIVDKNNMTIEPISDEEDSRIDYYQALQQQYQLERGIKSVV